MDLIYIAGIAALLALTFALTAGCEKLSSRTPGDRP